MSTENYNCLNLILQLVIGGAMICTFVIYYKQLNTMRFAARAQNLISVFNIIQSQDVRAARTEVILNLKGRTIDTWTEDEKKSASIVCANYHLLGLLLKEDFIDRKLILENWKQSIINCYDNLSQFIRDRSPGGDKLYWNAFTDLYIECKKLDNNSLARHSMVTTFWFFQDLNKVLDFFKYKPH